MIADSCQDYYGNIKLSNNRAPEFERNNTLEILLHELADDMVDSEKKLEKKYLKVNQKYPLILLVGPLRSGTTLFLQWLANTGAFAYPTNLLSRFYHSPILGTKIQLLLTDPRYRFRYELQEFQQATEYNSENGKTRGALSVNEFWYFWRQYFDNPSRDVWSDIELEKSLDSESLRSALIGMMDVLNKPLAAKGMLFNYNIPLINKLFDKLIIIQLIRDPVSNISSALSARKRQCGNINEWYSFDIPEKSELQNHDPLKQVAGQVQCINNAINRGLIKIPEYRYLKVNYEEFCIAPERIYEKLRKLLDTQGFLIGEKYSGPNEFIAHYYKSNNEIKTAIDWAKSKFPV